MAGTGRFENPPMVFANECDSSRSLRSRLFFPLFFPPGYVFRAFAVLGYWKTLIKRNPFQTLCVKQDCRLIGQSVSGLLASYISFCEAWECRAAKSFGKIGPIWRLSSLKHLQDFLCEFFVVENLIFYYALERKKFPEASGAKIFLAYRW